MKLKYNSPVVLTFALISTIVLLFTGGTSENEQSSALLQVFMSIPQFDFSNPVDYFRLVSHTIGHANWEHLIGNMSLILVIGPVLEEKYGSKQLLLMMVFTAVCSGIITVLFSENPVLGASGIVFMMITLSSFGSFKYGEIPITFILVVILYIGKELMQSLEEDNISQMGHIIGGICGGVLGFINNRKASKNIPNENPVSTVAPEKPTDEYL